MDLTNIETLTKELPNLTISKIAMIIAMDWKAKSKTGIYFGAVPYLQAMATMTSVKDNYGADDGKSIVFYFLSNASTWKGEVAKAIKKELNKRVK